MVHLWLLSFNLDTYEFNLFPIYIKLWLVNFYYRIATISWKGAFKINYMEALILLGDLLSLGNSCFIRFYIPNESLVVKYICRKALNRVRMTKISSG